MEGVMHDITHSVFVFQTLHEYRPYCRHVVKSCIPGENLSVYFFVVLCPSNIYGHGRYRLVTDSAHSWQRYSAVPLADHITDTMAQYPIFTLSLFYVNHSLSYPINAEHQASRLGSDKYQLYKSLV